MRLRAWIGHGIGMAQGLSLLSSILILPILSRVFTLEELGAYATYSALVAILQPLMTLRLETTLVRIDNRESRVSVAWIAFLVSVVLTVISVIALTGVAILPSYWGFGLLLAAIQAVDISLLSVQGSFKGIAYRRIFQSLFLFGAQLWICRSPDALPAVPRAEGLILLDVISRGIALLGVLIQGGSFLSEFQFVRLSGVSHILRQSLDRVTYGSASSLLSVLSFNLPILVVRARLGPDWAHLFNLALRIGQIPNMLVGFSGAVEFNHLLGSSSLSGSQLTEGVRKIGAERIPFLILYILMVILSPVWFGWIFAESWKPASTLAVLFLPSVLFNAIVAPFTGLESYLHLSRAAFFFQAVLFIGRILSVWLLPFFWFTAPHGGGFLFYGLLNAVLWYGYGNNLLKQAGISVGLLLQDLGARMMAFLLLLLLSPGLVFLSLLIFFTEGSPIFFLQRRVGYQRELFTIYKLRTMNAGARTRLGRVLKRLGLDELPQLLNIVQGSMAFLGPRPLTPEDVERLSGHGVLQQARFSVKPGLTGISQLFSGIGAETTASVEKFHLSSQGIGLNINILGLAAVSMGMPMRWVRRLALNLIPELEDHV